MTWPPTTWRVTTKGARPPKDTTLAAIATPSRVATWASTSVSCGPPPAITTTEEVAARAAWTAAACAAAEYDENASPSAW